LDADAHQGRGGRCGGIYNPAELFISMRLATHAC
jgi:hypothetical protein